MRIDDQTLTFQGTVAVTGYASPGPKTIARAGELALRAMQYATVVEGGAAVGTGVSAPALVAAGVVALAVGMVAGLAVAAEAAGERGLRHAQALALRQGYAVTIAAEAIGRTEAVNRFVDQVDAEYTRLGTDIAPV